MLRSIFDYSERDDYYTPPETRKRVRPPRRPRTAEEAMTNARNHGVIRKTLLRQLSRGMDINNSKRNSNGY